MKILKQFFSVLFVLLCVVGTGYAATFDGVRELVSRRAPWLGKHIQFKEIASSDGDCFILQTVGKKLVVQATGANADRKSTRLNSSHTDSSRMPSSA